MLKKAKKVNLSLKSPKQYSPTIHIAQNTVPNYFNTNIKKPDCLLNHCYQAIKIITDGKNKLPLK